jgi:hypothetical protein
MVIASFYLVRPDQRGDPLKEREPSAMLGVRNIRQGVGKLDGRLILSPFRHSCSKIRI